MFLSIGLAFWSSCMEDPVSKQKFCVFFQNDNSSFPDAHVYGDREVTAIFYVSEHRKVNSGAMSTDSGKLVLQYRGRFNSSDCLTYFCQHELILYTKGRQITFQK